MTKRAPDSDLNENSVKRTAPIAPIFTNAARGSQLEGSIQLVQGSWKVIPNELMVFTPNNIEHREKIAGFDLDGTLIKTKSGNVFPKDNFDWQLWDPSVLRELRETHKNGHKIVIFTNQKGISTKSVDVSGFKMKILNICAKIGIPIQVFISLGSPNFRKPYPGMWDYLETSANGDVVVDRSKSFYIGDAAGRLKTSSRKNNNDHSTADRLFALNLGIKFQTPEQLFLKKPKEEEFALPEFNPAEFLKISKKQFEPVEPEIPGKNKEILIFVGSPASGKSKLAVKLAERYNYAIVNQDELKTWQACVKKTNEYLEAGRSVIVDNTNRDVETRARFVNLAKSLSVACRCFVMNCTIQMAYHNNRHRYIINGSDAQHKNVSDFVIKMFFNNYKKPSLNEGFDEIFDVNFVEDFKDQNHKKIYSYWLCER